MKFPKDELPKLFLKNEVHLNGAHLYPEMWRIIQVAREEAPDLQGNSVWITSANDSTHMEGSLHYKNRAFDIRTRNVIEGHTSARVWQTKMQLKLGIDYQIILESDHLHCELDPKET